MPRTMVMTQLMGSRPGIRNRATTPTIVPKTAHQTMVWRSKVLSSFPCASPACPHRRVHAKRPSRRLRLANGLLERVHGEGRRSRGVVAARHPERRHGLTREIDERALDYPAGVGKCDAEAHWQRVVAVVLPAQRRARADAREPGGVWPELGHRDDHECGSASCDAGTPQVE